MSVTIVYRNIMTSTLPTEYAFPPEAPTDSSQSDTVKASRATTASRISSFGAVGIINTLIDFGILNLLHLVVGWPIIASNIVSASVAMIGSFFMNRQLVFRSASPQKWRQAVLFFAITAVGVYGLQSITIWLCAHPLSSLVAHISHVLATLTLHHLSHAFIQTNGIKALATLVSLVWNYIWYKKVVFAPTAP